MEFKGTKGKWEVSNEIGVNSYGVKFITIDFEGEKDSIDIYIDRRIDDVKSLEISQADAKLIATAPEMFDMLKQAKTTICRLRLSISVHPDCEENSEFADYVDLADEKEKQIQQLLTKITE